MILTLTVTTDAARLGDADRKEFAAEGGSIGRDKTSDWVLSHTKVSSCHAVISYVDAVFYIEDRSRNGVCINSSKNRLVRGRPYALKSGDRILIDPYEIDVSISRPDDDTARRPFPEWTGGQAAGDPFGSNDPFEPFGQPRHQSATPPIGPSRDLQVDTPTGQELDPLKLLDPGGATPKPAAAQAPRASDLERKAAMEGHFQPPAFRAPAIEPSFDPTAIPADYDPESPDDFSEPFEPPAPPPRQHTPEPHVAQPVTPPPAVAEPLTPRPATAQPQTPPPAITQPLTPPPAAAQSPRLAPSAPQDVSIPEAVEPLHPAADATPSARTTPSPAARSDAIDSGLADVLAGAGLEGVPVTPQLARSFGQIVRVVVSGVMDVLRSRQHIKDEFRMRLTQFRPADNNPLKFSANVDDALHNLLVKRNPAYLAPVAAFEDAFDDLRNHQMAMLAGMRVAFESMLAELDPDRLQHEFDRQLKNSAVLRLTARFRYWGLFRDRRVEMAKDPEATFRKLFGEEFARAYEEQLNRLKAENRAREPGANAPGQSGP